MRADLRDRSADHAAEARVAPGDVDPRDLALFVGVGAQGDRDRPVADAVVALDAVAGRPHAGDAGRHARVRRDPPAGSDANACLARESDARRDTETEHHEVAGDRPVARHDRAHPTVGGDLERLDTSTGDQLDAEAADRVGNERTHIGV